MSKRKGNNRDGELAAYFKFAVRHSSQAIVARFHQYDHALEFAGVMLARIASANSALPSGWISIEWRDDDGRTHSQTITLTLEQQEVSG
ncbi:MAG: hypothetical protein IT430_13805 [Phycisphaerales bacterium]|nr:hypothetical protein [Phycisphaerales bacterium]